MASPPGKKRITHVEDLTASPFDRAKAFLDTVNADGYNVRVLSPLLLGIHHSCTKLTNPPSKIVPRQNRRSIPNPPLSNRLPNQTPNRRNNLHPPLCPIPLQLHRKPARWRRRPHLRYLHLHDYWPCRERGILEYGTCF